jgi:ribosomal protein S18 acetylase RimI-like enzyme
MENPAIEIITYQPEHQPWFEKFNRDWIEKYFWMEPIDVQVLQHPEEFIINKGGKILMAQYNKEMAGTVALKFVENGVYEFTKMAVDEKFQGKKIGYALSIAAIEKAKQLGASKIILYSNTKLETAISLYRKLGFKEVPLDGPYKRSDIKMEFILSPAEGVSIRKATKKDMTALRALAIKTYSDSFGEMNSKKDMDLYLEEAFNQKKIETEFNEPDSIFFLALLNDELVGYARVRNNQEEFQDDGALEIHRVYVAEHVIGKRVGQLLLNHCIQHAKDIGKKSVWLGVWEKNDRAFRFYKKNGFEEFGQHDFIMGKDIQTDILMKKVL